MMKDFQKHMMGHLFVATKKFWLLQGRAIEKKLVVAMFTTKKIFGCQNVHNQNSLVTTKRANQISSITHPCGD
jgi:hypothetical protein